MSGCGGDGWSTTSYGYVEPWLESDERMRLWRITEHNKLQLLIALPESIDACDALLIGMTAVTGDTADGNLVGLRHFIDPEEGGDEHGSAEG